jgi:lipoyl(octanoyl) transferase
MTAAAAPIPRPLLRWLDRAEYELTWRAMQRFTDERDAATADELWLLEHPPVFTLGMNADPAHVLGADGIPVVRVDRGGQVTYHGPGQLVAYALWDLRRAQIGVRELVTALELAVIHYVASFGIEAVARRDAPGVYVNGAKLASVGIRVRRGASYHGLALNVSMGLEPFGRINPCGYPGLSVTQLAALGGPQDVREVARGFGPVLLAGLRAAGAPGSLAIQGNEHVQAR